MDLFLIHLTWPGPTAKLSCYSFPSWHPEDKSPSESSGRCCQMISSKDNSSPKQVNLQIILWSRAVSPSLRSLLPEVAKVSPIIAPKPGDDGIVEQSEVPITFGSRDPAPRGSKGFLKCSVERAPLLANLRIVLGGKAGTHNVNPNINTRYSPTLILLEL